MQPYRQMAVGDSVQLRYRSPVTRLSNATVTVDDPYTVRLGQVTADSDGVRFRVVAREAGLVHVFADAPGAATAQLTLLIQPPGPTPPTDALRLSVLSFIPLPSSYLLGSTASPALSALSPVLSVQNVSTLPQMIYSLEVDAPPLKCTLVPESGRRIDPGETLRFVLTDQDDYGEPVLLMGPVSISSPPATPFVVRAYTKANGAVGLASSESVLLAANLIGGDWYSVARTGNWLPARTVC